MNNKIHDGGPAFPVPEAFHPDANELYQADCRGMTLRDWFAGQAIIALAQRPETGIAEDAEIAYAIADLMLRERNGGAK